MQNTEDLLLEVETKIEYEEFSDSHQIEFILGIKNKSYDSLFILDCNISTTDPNVEIND